MDRMSVKDAAEKWGISERRIQKLCEEGSGIVNNSSVKTRKEFSKPL